jgi:3-oxoadipate enol-lactonase
MRDSYLQLAEAVRAGMIAEVADALLQIFFAPKTFNEKPELIELYRRKLENRQNNEGIYQAALAVFSRGDITDRLDSINVPTLVIVGELDIPTPPDRAELIAERIPGARLVTIPETGHMSPTEDPVAVAKAIRAFLKDL